LIFVIGNSIVDLSFVICNLFMKTIFQTSAGGIVFKKVKSEKLKVKSYVWLICQHSQHHGWVFPKGLVGDEDAKESMKTAALREVEEEGGVKAKIINKKTVKTEYQYQFEGNLIKKTVYYFLMEYISGDPNNHDWEMSEAKFVLEKEVKKILTYPSDKQAFETILKGL
jgi:8-oxo-dGTP pyrophosphatase MutT (NUDIX family)